MKPAFLLNDLVSSLSAEIERRPTIKPEFSPEYRPKEIWKQKIFCILSSQFSAERATVITDQILESVPFFDFNLDLHEIEAECFYVLNNPNNRYRFPRSRAHQIALCWFPFSQIQNEYLDYIHSFSYEDEARSSIVETFPGIGMKQASMLMRNIGASKTLAVIDIHILSYLSICHGWDPGPLSPKRYRDAETIMRDEALRIGIELNVFDVVVWTAVRTMKRARAHV